MIERNSEEIWLLGAQWECVCMVQFRMSPNAPRQPVIALYSWTAHPHWSQIHHAATQRQRGVTAFVKVPGKGFLSRKMTPVNAAKWHNPAPTTQLSGEEGGHPSHTPVTTLWPWRSPRTLHVTAWLGMSLWFALIIECFPRQTMSCTRDLISIVYSGSLTCLPPPTLIYHSREA